MNSKQYYKGIPMEDVMSLPLWKRLILYVTENIKDYCHIVQSKFNIAF